MKVVALGDLHCGHHAGLTPPSWWVSKSVKPSVHEMQKQCWQWYAKQAKRVGHVDVLICNGDAIDGKGDRSGGTEQLAPDMLDQCDMAVDCLNTWNADRCLMTCGTSYHTDSKTGEEMERLVAKALNAEIHSHYYADLCGVIFDLRHSIGGSSIPHGRGTALAKEKLWNILWAEREQVPKAQVVIRSHVHYHSFIGGPGWLAMTLPALQAPGSKFGAKMCSGVVDFGFVEFDINKGRIDRWEAHTVTLKNIAEVVVVR